MTCVTPGLGDRRLEAEARDELVHQVVIEVVRFPCWTTSRNAGDSNDSSPPASLATSSVASLPAGALWNDELGWSVGCALGATCSDGALMCALERLARMEHWL